tara:strand:- start:1887 stop:2132 length:246 start_codon:yes stop_codon:yes gene_type:complete
MVLEYNLIVDIKFIFLSIIFFIIIIFYNYHKEMKLRRQMCDGLIILDKDIEQNEINISNLQRKIKIMEKHILSLTQKDIQA